MYEYYWGHTAAQIELIDADQPLTLYKKHDPNEGKKPGETGWVSDPQKLDGSVEKRKKRKKAREERGFDLKKLINTGEKVPVEEEQ